MSAFDESAIDDVDINDDDINDTRTPQERRDSTFHESGHAVAALALKLTVYKITVDPEPAERAAERRATGGVLRGYVDFDERLTHVGEDAASQRAFTQRLAKHQIVYCAGPIAVKMSRGEAIEPQSQAEETAYQLLSKVWPCVERLANSLQGTTTTWSGYEAARIASGQSIQG